MAKQGNFITSLFPFKCTSTFIHGGKHGMTLLESPAAKGRSKKESELAKQHEVLLTVISNLPSMNS